MCVNIETAKIHHFPFGTNEKVVVLGVPILKHFRVYLFPVIYHKYWDMNMKACTSLFIFDIIFYSVKTFNTWCRKQVHLLTAKSRNKIFTAQSSR